MSWAIRRAAWEPSSAPSREPFQPEVGVVAVEPVDEEPGVLPEEADALVPEED